MVMISIYLQIIVFTAKHAPGVYMHIYSVSACYTKLMFKTNHPGCSRGGIHRLSCVLTLNPHCTWLISHRRIIAQTKLPSNPCMATKITLEQAEVKNKQGINLCASQQFQQQAYKIKKNCNAHRFGLSSLISRAMLAVWRAGSVSPTQE